MADITKIIAQLKRKYPEAADDLAELELVADVGDDDGEEDEPMDEAAIDASDFDEDQTMEDEPADGGFSMPDLEKEADLMSEEDIEANPGVPGKRKKRKPDDEAGDEPVDVNGKY